MTNVDLFETVSMVCPVILLYALSEGHMGSGHLLLLVQVAGRVPPHSHTLGICAGGWLGEPQY